MLRASTAATLSCILVLSATACGSEADGAASAVPASNGAPGTKGSRLPKYGAPAIADPLKFSPIVDDPCSALTQSQVESFAGEFSDTAINEVKSETKYCNWHFDDPSTGYGLGVVGGGVNVEDGAHGLTTLYAQERKGFLTTFKPVGDIAGYPAVIYAAGGEREGKCFMAVGLSDKRAYIASASLDPDHPKRGSPCSVAKKLARYVVQNLKGV